MERRCLILTLPTYCSELLVSSAKADLTLQDAVKNTALHLACTKVSVTAGLFIIYYLNTLYMHYFTCPHTNLNGSDCLYHG